MIRPVYPMLAKTGKPEDLDLRADWVIQPKLDGIRCIVVKTGDSVKLYNRNLTDITARFPDVVLHIAARNAMLDGEIICTDADGMPNFQLVQTRANRLLDIDEAAEANPAKFMAFDLPLLNSNYITDYALRSRLIFLADILPRATMVPLLTKEQALQAQSQREGEGIMLKKPSSVYRAGERTADWLKVKWLQETLVYVWRLLPGIGKRADTFGAVEAVTSDGKFVGRIGTGFTDADLARISSMATAERMNTPLKVRFDAYTNDGKLKFPRFVGFVDAETL